MEYERPVVLSLAGFDPCGGAGVLADVKTFEQHRCLGFSAITAITVQTENTFYKTEWLPVQTVIEQCEPLFDQYKITVVKIGIIENLEVLEVLIDWIKSKNNDVKIIWDTVLSASAGSSFISDVNNIVLTRILKQVFLITPNSIEICRLANGNDAGQSARMLSEHCRVYLKGGHSQQERGVDVLFDGNRITRFLPNNANLPAKHGSGCILSSAIAANIALGMQLEEACAKAKNYIEKVLDSNKNLLAYHVQ